MNWQELLTERQNRLQLITSTHTTAADLVKWFGAIQAQDHGQALWNIGSKINHTKSQVDAAIASGTIIRTWSLRGTLQFHAAEEVSAYLHLVAPKFIRSIASRYRDLNLDEPLLNKCIKLFEKALHKNHQLTREAMQQVLMQHQIDASGLRLAHILQYAAMKQSICFGPRKNNEYTFELLSEKTTVHPGIDREQQLLKLLNSYFQSHAPASLLDFLWWSGLTLQEVKPLLNSNDFAFTAISVDGHAYYVPNAQTVFTSTKNKVFLLAGFDDFLLAYRDRSRLVDEPYTPLVFTKNGLFNPALLINGKIAGVWKRTFKKNTVVIQVQTFRKLTTPEHKELLHQLELYKQFSEQKELTYTITVIN